MGDRHRSHQPPITRASHHQSGGRPVGHRFPRNTNATDVVFTLLRSTNLLNGGAWTGIATNLGAVSWVVARRRGRNWRRQSGERDRHRLPHQRPYGQLPFANHLRPTEPGMPCPAKKSHYIGVALILPVSVFSNPPIVGVRKRFKSFIILFSGFKVSFHCIRRKNLRL